MDYEKEGRDFGSRFVNNINREPKNHVIEAMPNLAAKHWRVVQSERQTVR